MEITENRRANLSILRLRWTSLGSGSATRASDNAKDEKPRERTVVVMTGETNLPSNQLIPDATVAVLARGSLIIRKFLRKCFTDFYGEAAELLNKVIGWDFSAGELRRVGERIQIAKRLFNQPEGWQPEDDWLPPRLLTGALPTGVAHGVALTAGELREMISAYYQARGLNGNGFVPEKNCRCWK